MTLLSENEIHQLTTLGWKFENHQLIKTIIFSQFSTIVKFLSEIIPTCETLNHHPNIEISHTKVRLTIFTHSTQLLTKLDEQFIRTIQPIIIFYEKTN